MKDYKKMYLDLVEEISNKHEEFVFKNMDAIVKDDDDFCKVSNAIIDVLYHLLSYSSDLSLKYDSDIIGRLCSKND